MAEESLTDKFWKLASYGLGYDAENAQQSASSSSKKGRKENISSIWPSFVKSSDKKRWGSYDEPVSSDFDVRGKNYLKDGIKNKSLPSLFKLADLEFFECSLSESYHIATNKKSFYQKYGDKLPKDTFFLIYNMQLSSLNTAIIATFIIKTNQPQYFKNDEKFIEDILDDLSSTDSSNEEEEDDEKEKDDNKNAKNIKDEDVDDTNGGDDDHKSTLPPPSSNEQSKEKKITFTVEDIESIPNIEQVVHSKVVDDDNLWCPKLGYEAYDNYIWPRVLKGDELFINQRLKIIPKLVEGSWYFTFPQRPSIIGMKTPQRSYRGPNYLEIDCEADQNMVARQITKAAWHISTYLAVDVMLCFEVDANGNQIIERGPACTDNFQIVKFLYEGDEFWSAEQCFQAQKFKQNSKMRKEITKTMPKDKEKDGAYGMRVWELGQSRASPLRQNYESEKVKLMFMINLAKYICNKDLQKELVETTQDNEIRGGASTWACSKWNGLIQMLIRKIIKEDQDLKEMYAKFDKMNTKQIGDLLESMGGGKDKKNANKEESKEDDANTADD